MAFNVSHSVAYAPPAARVRFIRAAFFHLAAALLALIVVAACLLQFGFLEAVGETRITRFHLALFALLIFGPALVANSWGKSAVGDAAHYLGLAAYVVIGGLSAMPVLYALVRFAATDILLTAAAMTAFLAFGALATALLMTEDYSPITAIFCLSGAVMVGMIAASVLFGVNLGVVVFGVMQFYAIGAVLFRTQSLLKEVTPQQGVGAALVQLAAIPLFVPTLFRNIVFMANKDARVLANADIRTESRHAQREHQDEDAKEEARQRREREMAEYVARQMARGRKA